MSKDIGTSTVDHIDPLTGYPADDNGHLLNPISDYDGHVIPDWDKPGTELDHFTDPYGVLQFAIGSGDDFLCMDYRTIDAGPRGQFIILDSVLNSETGSFIQGQGYEVLPINTRAERVAALNAVFGVMDGQFDDVRHTEKGWNQDVWYFRRVVAHTLFPELFRKWKDGKFVDWTTDRMLRHGGKRIDAVIDSIK